MEARNRINRWGGSACYKLKKMESAGKPGSVVDSHSSGSPVTRGLKRPTREPCGPHVAACTACSPIWSCSGWGFPCRRVLPPARCALTAPFHPYLIPLRGHRRYLLCGTFRRLAPPRRYLAPCPPEPGLSSIPAGTATVWPTPLHKIQSPGATSTADFTFCRISHPRLSLM
jgi:hypothetical protein